MLSHMSSMRKILPVLLCLAMLAGGAALYAQDAAAQAPAAPAPEAPAAAAPEAAAPGTAEDRYRRYGLGVGLDGLGVGHDRAGSLRCSMEG